MKRFVTIYIVMLLIATNAQEFVCSNPEQYANQVVGDGQCVALVREACGAPKTSLWQQGRVVKANATITPGTAIATFKDGKYPNSAHFNHAAIYISQDEDGLWVWDQWAGRRVGTRYIKFKGGKGNPSNDGDAFFTIKVK